MNQPVTLEGSIAQSPYAGRSAQMFPHLTPVQITRLSAHGRKIATQKSQILSEPGDHPPMYVVLSGSIEIIQPTLTGESLIVVHTPGSFTGDVGTLRAISSALEALGPVKRLPGRPSRAAISAWPSTRVPGNGGRRCRASAMA